MASNVANTQGERAASATANRWTTRDVLTFVIFNIVIIVATMVVKLAEDAVLSPQNTFFVGSWLFPLVSTPFYQFQHGEHRDGHEVAHVQALVARSRPLSRGHGLGFGHGLRLPCVLLHGVSFQMLD